MVSSIGGAQPTQHTQPQPVPHKPQGSGSQNDTPQDTVQLSPGAQKAASGDVDHDGDSH